MSSLGTLWLEFIFCSIVIVYCGTRLSKYGDVIAEKTGLGRAWIGMILLASITSLPELATGISAVAIVGAPDIAIGDVVGSCVYNLAILASMDLFDRKTPLFKRADFGHIISSAMGILLISIFIAGVLLGPTLPSIGHVGLYTPIIFFVYLVGLRAVYYYEKRGMKEAIREVALVFKYEDISAKRAWSMYLVNGAAIVMAASWIPMIAKSLAELTSWGEGFMGSVFVAMTTSLPEVVVSIAAIRIGAHDLAIGNMFGSNMFNILVVGVDDIFYLEGPILNAISADHLITALAALMMTAVAVAGLTYRPDKKAFMRVGWDTVTILSLWLLSFAYLVYAGT